MLIKKILQLSSKHYVTNFAGLVKTLINKEEQGCGDKLPKCFCMGEGSNLRVIIFPFIIN